MSNLFPIPDKVGAYGTEEEYSKCRRPYWVHFEDRIKLALKGRYNEILPVFTEFIPDYRCTFRCPLCPYRDIKSRSDTWKGLQGEKKNTKSQLTSMDETLMKLLINKLAENNVDLLWTGGGETFYNEFTLIGLLYAIKKGLDNAIYTNGSLLNSKSLKIIMLNVKPAWTRFSLNTGSKEVHTKFHGYDKKEDYFGKVVENIKCVSKLKAEIKGNRPVIGISVIFDKRNIEDFDNIASLLEEIINETGQGIDYALFRPLINYNHFAGQLSVELLQKAYDLLVNPEGRIRTRLERVGIKVCTGFELHSLKGLNENFWEKGFSKCLASGLFGVVCPNGDMFHCTETTGKKEFKIGNLKDQSLYEIWTGSRRKEVIESINTDNCPPRCRPGRLNKVFSEVEQLRRKGKLDVVEKWINDLRRVCPGPPPNKFIG